MEKCKKALEKDNPDLYAKIYEPKAAAVIESLTDEVSEKLNLESQSEESQANLTGEERC